MRAFLSRVAGILIFGCCAAAQVHAQAQIELTAGFYRVEAEVAYTNPQRMVGLMNRRSMAGNHGMLFVFDQPERHCMWMKNTLIPLAVAFIDDKGRIINVEEMEPQTEVSHCASAPAKFALEMNTGWFKSRGLGTRTALGGIERAPAAR